MIRQQICWCIENKELKHLHWQYHQPFSIHCKKLYLCTFMKPIPNLISIIDRFPNPTLTIPNTAAAVGKKSWLHIRSLNVIPSPEYFIVFSLIACLQITLFFKYDSNKILITGFGNTNFCCFHFNASSHARTHTDTCTSLFYFFFFLQRTYLYISLVALPIQILVRHDLHHNYTKYMKYKNRSCATVAASSLMFLNSFKYTKK